MFDEASLVSREEVAAALGISPESVRSTMRRHGLRERRGWPRDEVDALVRRGQGHRSDLEAYELPEEAGLRPGEKAILAHLHALRPRPATRAELAEHTPNSNTLRAYLSNLRRRGLIVETDGQVRLSGGVSA